ncbi:hypothetical protein [Kitasatospora sp. NPDC094015]|uniref:hypothetical protein n=1 Tax=Kitasatospora sp. NPDC094015 TaxID=3155205 RepID=UPI00332F1689
MARAVPFALVCTLVAAAGHALVGGGSVTPVTLAVGFAAVCAVGVFLAGRERSMAAIAGALGAGQLGLHLLFHTLSTVGGTGGLAASTARMTGMVGMAGMAGMAAAQPGGSGTTLPELAGRLICDDRPGNGPSALPLGSTAEQVVRAAGLDPQAYAAGGHAGGAHAAGVLGLSPAMLLGHLVAAVLAGWWLRRGERALWRLLRLAAGAAQEWAIPLRRALALVTAVLLGPLGSGPRRVRPGRPAEDWRLPGAAALRHSVHRRGPPAAAFAR